MATTTLPLLLPRIVCAAFFACLPGLVAGIRKDIGLAAPIMCRSTVQGRHLISDDNGSADSGSGPRLDGINISIGSLGPDQPAQVVDEAPSNLNPGACLYMQMDERLTCDGSHQHTRRLCPCA
uniref:Uncharacterized protein n=1 Tax=Oryza meridionalis TaxID=40149 RepID=A0A0E0F4L1_9ORYZ